MKVKKTCAYLALLFFCFMLFCNPNKTFAKQDETNLIGGLSYEVLYPENQTNKNLGYFDLTMKPGQRQKVFLKLYNSIAKELTVEIRLNAAKTNNIGKVEYGANQLPKDASLTTDFTTIVNGPEKVVIPATSSKQVDLLISLPESTADSLIAGGIQMQLAVDNSENVQGKKDVVVNEFAFLIGMLLRVGDTSNIKPELKLNKTYIAFKDRKSHFFVNISNIQPVYLEGMDIDILVRKANKQKVLFEYEKKEMRMAPNSMIDFPVDLTDKGLAAGRYSAQIQISSKSGGKWSWTEDFEVNTLEAKSLNKQLENKANSKWVFQLLIVIFFVSFVVFGLSFKVIKSQGTTRKRT
ncbi:DUF916 and DUF3324 domain-containing protein [Enterococcus quebecensis]|uniref:DUF916 and DUF3324 domain-containing protein n=1 Tax=Enterococcus quebecensis TaxID=903983 RepID=UPI000B2D1B31